VLVDQKLILVLKVYPQDLTMTAMTSMKTVVAQQMITIRLQQPNVVLESVMPPVHWNASLAQK